MREMPLVEFSLQLGSHETPVLLPAVVVVAHILNLKNKCSVADSDLKKCESNICYAKSFGVMTAGGNNTN